MEKYTFEPTQEERYADLEFTRAQTRQIELENTRTEMELKDVMASSDEAQVYHLFEVIEPLAASRFIQITNIWSRRNPGQDINVLLSSPGGEVSSGLAIFDHMTALKDRGHTISIKVVSMAASMAAIILQGGSERIISPSAVLMLHEGSFGFMGTLSSLQDSMKAHNLMLGRCERIITDRSGMTSQKYKRLIRRKDAWLGPEEALDLGLVDRVEA